MIRLISRILVVIYRAMPRQAVCTLTPSCSQYALSHGITVAARRAAAAGDACGEVPSNQPNWRRRG